MHYSLTLSGQAPWPALVIGSAFAPGREPGDPCWPVLRAHLKMLRDRGRRAVRIVDVHCADGALLIHAAREARSLEFLSVECLGTDVDRDDIEVARWRSRLLRDTAIGLEFEVGEAIGRLEAEADFPADVVLYKGSAGTSKAFRHAAKRAGRLVLAKSCSAGEQDT